MALARLLIAALLLGTCMPGWAQMPPQPAAGAPDCAQPFARDMCDSARLEAADAGLNTTYAQARQTLREQATEGACSRCADAERQLVRAQRAWIALRDQDCEAVHGFNADGTSRNPARMQCLITHTQDRARQLRAFYELP